jgi:hypothetical protein
LNAGAAKCNLVMWITGWFLLVAGITLAGGCLGALLFPLAGMCLRMDLSVAEMSLNGFKDGAFLAFIWAPGVGLVACLMIRHRKATRGGD